MSAKKLELSDADLVKLVLEFCERRELNATMLSLERETGIMNAQYSEDLAFLRQLILDGSWDDVSEFLQPLREVEGFESDVCAYNILKCKYLELLCVQTEDAAQQEALRRSNSTPSPLVRRQNELVAQDLASCLQDLELVASKADYNTLSVMSTLSSISEHPSFANWTPLSGRVECFRAILPHVEPFMQYEPTSNGKSAAKRAQNDRLVQLVAKGLLYEACIDYCQTKAIRADENGDANAAAEPQSSLSIPELLDAQHSVSVDETDSSLVSWLEALPDASFNLPFEQHELTVQRAALVKPAASARTSNLLEQICMQNCARTRHANSNSNGSNNGAALAVAKPTAAATSAALLLSQSFVMLQDVALVAEAAMGQEITHSGASTNSDLPVPLPVAKRSQTLPSNSSAQLADAAARLSLHSASQLPKFVPVTMVEDQQAVRAVAWHPSGKFYAVGSNSRVLRFCAYPTAADLNRFDSSAGPLAANVVHKRAKYHRGSIYCLTWNSAGDLLASGSNDKAVRLLRVDPRNAAPISEHELTMHDGTIRDVAFLDKGNQLLSAGADCRVHCTDCNSDGSARLVRTFDGHSAQVSALFVLPGSAGTFVSGACDRTARFWDIRSRDAVHVFAADSAFASLCIDPAGRVLCGAHEDASCSLFDIRGGRVLQTFISHTDEVRSARIANIPYAASSDVCGPLLLTGSYDCSVILTSLHGDLLQSLPFVTVGEHKEKVIQCRWHPTQSAFVSTSADRTAVCWCSL